MRCKKTDNKSNIFYEISDWPFPKFNYITCIIAQISASMRKILSVLLAP